VKSPTTPRHFSSAASRVCGHRRLALEINPCVLTATANSLQLDAKMTFGRQRPLPPQGFGGLDLTKRIPLEVEASKYGPQYIKLERSVGCMSTARPLGHGYQCDIIINTPAASPAKFLDVGGGASRPSSQKTHFAF